MTLLLFFKSAPIWLYSRTKWQKKPFKPPYLKITFGTNMTILQNTADLNMVQREISFSGSLAKGTDLGQPWALSSVLCCVKCIQAPLQPQHSCPYVTWMPIRGMGGIILQPNTRWGENQSQQWMRNSLLTTLQFKMNVQVQSSNFPLCSACLANLFVLWRASLRLRRRLVSGSLTSFLLLQ